MPITDFYVSFEKSSLNVTYPNDLGFKKKEFNLDNFKGSINIKNTSKGIKYLIPFFFYSGYINK